MKTLICTIAMLGLTVLFAPGARATVNFSTNYDVLTITAIIQTNVETIPTPGVDVYTLRSFTLNNAILLDLLGSSDWHHGFFPPGSKLVMSWDAANNVANAKDGDILVVDQTGTNVLYDASEISWSQSGKSFMTINFYDGQTGAYTANENNNSPGHYDFTISSNTRFEIDDGTGLFILTTGPSKDISSQNWNKNGPPDFTTWSDSDRAETYGAGTNINFGGIFFTAATIKISASGHGPGKGGWYYDNY